MSYPNVYYIDTDIVITGDPSISRKHATITVRVHTNIVKLNAGYKYVLYM